MTEDEAMMREAAAQFAQSVVLPRVQAMDDAGKFDDDIISAIFEQGFMGVGILKSTMARALHSHQRCRLRSWRAPIRRCP